MSAFVDMLVRLKDRAEQELRSSTSDTLPNPVAGIMGPQELHYNPLRDVPVVGGAINLGVNAPLHGAGLVSEGFGEAAKGLFGALTLAAAAGQRAIGDDNSEAGRDAARILAAGEGGHIGRALETARTSEDDLVSYLAGAGELASDLRNYSGLGAFGTGLSKAGGVAGGIGKGIQGVALAGEASNRLPMIPAAVMDLLPGSRTQIGKGLAEIPAYLRTVTPEKEIAPLIQAVKDSLPENAQQVANLGDNLDTAMRAPINANVEVPSPTGDVVQQWLARERETGLLPDGTPGPLEAPDWLRQTLLKNLEAPRGQKYPRTPRTVAEVAPSPQAGLSTSGNVSTLYPESMPNESPFIRQLEQASETANASVVGARASKWTPEEEAILAADPEVQRISEMLDIYRNAPEGVMDNGGIGLGSDRQKRIKRLGFQLADARKRALAGVAQPELAPAGVGAIADNTPMPVDLPKRIREVPEEMANFNENRRIPSNVNIVSRLDNFDGMQQEVLRLQDELGRVPTYDEIRYRTGSGPIQSRDLADWVVEQAAGDTPHPDLDRIDSLRGRELVETVGNLLEANYGSSSGKVLRNITGRGSFNGEGRLIGANGEDETRGLIEYLLRRSEMTEAERAAFQNSAFSAKQPAAALPFATESGGVGTAVASQPVTLRELATDPQFGGSELPGPSYFARKLGISNQEVNRGLAELEQEGVLKPLNKWYGLSPDTPQGFMFQPTQLGVAASGAGLGAAAGAALSDTEDGDPNDERGGVLGGALAGAALGAGLVTPGGRRNLEFAGALGREAIAKQGEAFSTGTKDINWKTLSGSWSGQTVENMRNLIQEFVSSVPMLLDKKGSLSVVAENRHAIQDAYIKGARDPLSLMPDRAKNVVGALGLTDLKDPTKMLLPDLGTGGFLEATGRMETHLNPFMSAIIEGTLPSLTPLGSVPLLGNALGAAKGFTAPIRKEVYSVIDGITKSSFRSAIWEIATKDAAEQAARLFESSVLQKTNRVLSLPADGMFSPQDVRKALVNVPPGTAESLVREWESYTRAINATGEEAAKQAFGDFTKFNKDTATRGEKIFHGAETGLRAVVPFSSWYIRALPIAAEIASHHPAFTLATLGLLVDQSRQLKEEGKPGYMVGTVPFDSDTPVIGKFADVLTGGRGGTGRVNVLNGILPFAGQALGSDELGDDATLYQKVESWAGRAGFSFNPIVQGVMYAVGQDWQRPGAMSRTANLEQAMPGPTGRSFLQGPLDFVRKAGGNSVSTTTPVDRRIAQIVYEQTGLPINAKENAALAAATLNPEHPITKQAAREIAQGNVAKNLTSLTVPVQVSASTDFDQQIQAARAKSKEAGTDQIVKKTPEQEAADAVFQKAYPLQYAIAQGQQGNTGVPVDPLTQVYRGADTKGRAYQALAAWEAENEGLKYFAPSYYGAYKQELMQQLGLSPY